MKRQRRWAHISVWKCSCGSVSQLLCVPSPVAADARPPAALLPITGSAALLQLLGAGCRSRNQLLFLLAFFFAVPVSWGLAEGSKVAQLQ